MLCQGGGFPHPVREGKRRPGKGERQARLLLASSHPETCPGPGGEGRGARLPPPSPP